MSADAGVTCAACGELTLASGRFCIHCAAPLGRACGACGAAIIAGARFCMQCGAAVEGAALGASPPSPARREPPTAERRLVSVLFADLVGFTALSEHRDPEEVREILSAYFDRCRMLIERYGGVVEKFIGDAVMAVWGTPVAREDDAERAVRAALALSQAVTALGGEAGLPELRVRAGVLTGDAAVERGAEGEGMVLGDTVNTASRLQSIAAPGTVLVDDVTRRASEASIAYEPAGTHQVKGREQPVRAWTALRVIAGAGGARRSAALEAPFSGRDRELAAVIEAGEQSAAQGRARLVAIVGEAGSGKSRLLWEFFKYLDGIEEVRWWHEGRCLSYGEGVAYWALAEMVRSRVGIREEEPEPSAREKLRTAVQTFVADDRERRLVEPRLAHLLRLDERPDADRADLFSGWRLFFERLADTQPVILAFEDLQWADSGLLEFIDYLMEWSAGFPIFVVALGRSELRERRPGWEPLRLDPLEPAAVEQILEGLVPGLPEELGAEIRRRAEGIPLYAVETVRMLQDRGLLVREGARYTVTGDVSNLEVPETLHALVASRLDGLPGDERALLQSAAVLGQSFSAAAVAAITDRRTGEVTSMLDGLVVKQLLGRDESPLSPERGQYAFLQALLRSVAYGTLGRRTRKALHLAAARFLREAWPGEGSDVAEVLASHYLEAMRADETASDVEELRFLARETLAAAGRAAASLALGTEADHYFQQAAALAIDDGERAQLLEEAGGGLLRADDSAGAERRLREAIALREAAGDATGGSAAVTLAGMVRLQGRLEEARELLEPFRAAAGPIDRVVRAQALHGLALTMVFAGEFDEAGPLFDEAMATLEQQQEWPAVAEALVGYGVYMMWRRRLSTGMAIMRQAVLMAEEHDLPSVALRARYNLAGGALIAHDYAECLRVLDDALIRARERGDRPWEAMLRQQLIAPLAILGRWDEALAAGGSSLGRGDVAEATVSAPLATIAAARGDEPLLQRCADYGRRWADATHLDARGSAMLTLAAVANAAGEPARCVELVRAVLDNPGAAPETFVVAYDLGAEAALGTGEVAIMTELIAWAGEVEPVRRGPLVLAGRARLRAELHHLDGAPDAAARDEQEALDVLRAIGAAPSLARALLDRWRRHGDREALAEAGAICAELRASRWLAGLPERDQVEP
jgi:class 3 adenylate cyclase/tetratricopeptide (TPR) repeat protein